MTIDFAHNRREFLAAALPLTTAIAVDAASPPPVPAKGTDALKTLITEETLPVPKGAVRLGSPRMRVQGYVNRIQFAPKGSALVAASGSEIRAWDYRNGKPLFRVGYPTNGSVDAGRLTTKESFALLVRPNSGGNAEFHQYAFGTGKLIAKTPNIQTSYAQHTAFSVDGTLMAVISQEGLTLFDTASGKQKWREALPAQGTGGIRFFADASVLALAGKGEVKLYDAATGKIKSMLKVDGVDSGDGGKRRNVARITVQEPVISSDGRWLATGVGEDDVVCCWDVKSGAIKHTFKKAAKPVDFTPDGKELITYFEGTITFWSLSDGKSRQIVAPTDDDLTLSPDGRFFAAGSGDAVILVDSATGNLLPYSSDPPGLPDQMLFRRSDRLLGRLSGWGGWIEWSLSKGSARLLHPPQLGGWSPVSLSRDGQRALYRRRDLYSVRDTTTGRELGKFGSDDGTAVQSGRETSTMTPDGRTFIEWIPGKLRFIDLNGGTNREISRPGLQAATWIKISADGRSVAIGFSIEGRRGAVELVDVGSAALTRRIETDGEVASAVFSPDGEWLAIGYDIPDGLNRFGNRRSVTAVHEVATGKAVLRTPPDQNDDRHMAISADGRVIARLEYNEKRDARTIALWEVLSGTVRAKFDAGGSVGALAFSLDGRLLAASVHGAPVFVWNLHGTERPPAPGRANLEQAWSNLAKSDGATGFSAVKLLAARPDQSTRFLREVLPPIAPPEESKVTQLIADLDHRNFRQRELAARELTNLAERARGALKQALAGTLSPESRERIERLLAAQDRPSADYLRMARAVEAMEAAGSPDAIKLLEHWGSGAAGALFTRDAQAALKRLASRKDGD